MRPRRSPRTPPATRKLIQSPAEVLAAHRSLPPSSATRPTKLCRGAGRSQEARREHVPERDRNGRTEAVTFARERSFEREAVTDERELSAMRCGAV
jgi:hypothetical protein